MPMRSRVLGEIESELNQRLCFSFSLTRNITRPGARALHAGDRFLFRASLRNDCGFRLCNIRGVIDPTHFSEFVAQPFAVPDLRPGETFEIASAQAILTERPRDGSVFDQIGRVRMTTGIDLSEFRFQQSEQSLVCASPRRRVETAAPRLAGSDRSSDTDDPWGPVLPLVRTANR